MFQRLFFIALFTGYTSISFAFPCFITVAKDSCWIEYNVTVSVLDVSNDRKKMVDIIIPQGSIWARKKTECEPKQLLQFEAQFTPVFWQEDRGKKYTSIRYKTLPANIGPQETAWNINVCYPRDFSQVPLPPEAGSNCKCDFSNIPNVEPE